MMKQCPMCEQKKPWEDYYKRRDGSPTSYCKPCFAAYQLAHTRKRAKPKQGASDE